MREMQIERVREIERERDIYRKGQRERKRESEKERDRETERQRDMDAFPVVILLNAYYLNALLLKLPQKMHLCYPSSILWELKIN